MGHFATGVTVVTALDGDETVGMACNSFTSVSLDPPLVLFCAAKSSTTWPHIHNAHHFAVNVLGEEDEALCRTFAAQDVDRFAAATHHRGSTGAPILEDALAYIDCETEVEHDAGDEPADVVVEEDDVVGEVVPDERASGSEAFGKSA